jgi:hypothetical protein
MPNLRIVDFGYGFTGSAHDATAWQETRISKERETLLKDDDFIWADSAYPVCANFKCNIHFSLAYVYR